MLMTLVACQHAEKKREIKSATNVKQNDLPAMQLMTTSGQPVFTKALAGKIILILFQPECDHCQREAEQIQHNLGAFVNYQLYFISDVSEAELLRFANEYNLNTHVNIHFARTTADEILSNFGPLETPALFIYSAEGKLENKFIGETDIQMILSALK